MNIATATWTAHHRGVTAAEGVDSDMVMEEILILNETHDGIMDQAIDEVRGLEFDGMEDVYVAGYTIALYDRLRATHGNATDDLIDDHIEGADKPSL